MRISVILAGAAMAVAFPAFAQGQTLPDQSQPAAPAGAQAPTDAMPVDPAAPVDGAASTVAPTEAAPMAATAAPATSATDDAIAQNWSKYDPQNSGQLTPLAFGEWVMAQRGNDVSAQVAKSRTAKTANLPATQVLNATAGEFSRADSNRDRMVSRAELKTFLGG